MIFLDVFHKNKACHQNIVIRRSFAVIFKAEQVQVYLLLGTVSFSVVIKPQIVFYGKNFRNAVEKM